MKRVPTKHRNVWLAVAYETGHVSAVFPRRRDAAAWSRKVNDFAEADICGIRPAMTADRKKREAANG